MINKRYRRDYRPQEKLKQFSLNNSKGVDCTKSVVDADTVLEAENLTLNEDGTLSLRKRMQAAYKADSHPMHVLFTGKHVFVKKKLGGWGIEARDGKDTNVTITVKSRDYYTCEEVTLDWKSESETDSEILDSEIFDFSNPSFVNTNSSTIIGNCKVSLQAMADAGVADSTLYDSNVTSLPRYIQISKEEGESDSFILTVISPELTTLSSAEGEIPLNPNMALDNPYAIRDVYGMTVPRISGILPYVGNSKNFVERERYEVESDKVFIGDGETVTTAARYTFTDKDKNILNISSAHGGTSGAEIGIDVALRGKQPYVIFRRTDNLGIRANVSFKPSFKKIYAEELEAGGNVDVYELDRGIKKYCVLSYTIDNHLPDTTLLKRMQANSKEYSKITFSTTNVMRKDYFKGIFTIPDISKYYENVSDLKVAFSEHHADDTDPGTLSVKLSYVYTSDGKSEIKTLDEELVLNDYSIPHIGIGTDCEFALVYSDDLGFTGYVYLEDREVHNWSYLIKLSDYTPTFDELFGQNYLAIESCKCTLQTVSYALSDEFKNLKVSRITEQVGDKREFKPLSKLSHDVQYSDILLKAFCRLPKDPNVYYATWDYSFDGVSWNPYGAIDFINTENSKTVQTINEMYRPSENVGDVDDDGNARYVKRVYMPLNVGRTSQDYTSYGNVTSRIDVFPLALLYSIQGLPKETIPVLRFSIVTLREKDSEYYVNSTVSSYVWTPTVGDVTEYLETDMPNAVLGLKAYYSKTLYSFGDSKQTGFIYATVPDSFVTPMYSILEFSSNFEGCATALIPWRNYLIYTTQHSVHLSAPVSDGFTTKTVSTSIGVPYEDRRSLKSILNGFIFKSGDTVYYAYPNTYSSSDDILNLTVLSKPIEHLLSDCQDCEIYADVSDDSYILICSSESSTKVFIYNTLHKRWEYLTYPLSLSNVFKDARGVLTLVDSRGVEYTIFEEDIDRPPEESGEPKDIDLYMDTVFDELGKLKNIPIQYTWDTGQKADSIDSQKQFVESKIVFATLSERDMFPFTLWVAVDGDCRITKTDVSTDAPFWKTSTSDRGVLNTAIRLGGADTPATGAFNTLRQLVVRYSGKGKSIRHVIQGESVCNFKLYETYVRYKNINGK